jgi:hypothetical protein
LFEFNYSSTTSISSSIAVQPDGIPDVPVDQDIPDAFINVPVVDTPPTQPDVQFVADISVAKHLI